MIKKAFTLLELVFTIIIISIISSLIISTKKTDDLHLAALQLVSDLRYTQHLAMNDDIYNKIDSNWYKKRWQLVLGKNKNSDYKVAYTIFSDQPNYGGDANLAEVALNPRSINQVLSGGYTGTVKLDYNHEDFKGVKNLNIGATYGVTSYKLEGSCSGARISFDFLGRPMSGDSSSLRSMYRAGTKRIINENCKIILTDESNQNIIIVILPNTGKIEIEG